jgi:NAD-dependent SIR2 family protein deacetylase
VESVEIRGATVECEICGASFYVNAEQQLRWNQMGVEVRRRCPLCRKEGHRTKNIHYESHFNDEAFNRVMKAAKDEIARWKQKERR